MGPCVVATFTWSEGSGVEQHPILKFSIKFVNNNYIGNIIFWKIALIFFFLLIQLHCLYAIHTISLPPPPLPPHRDLLPVTQLYVSVDASTQESLKRIDRPLFKDYWPRFLHSLQALSEKVCHININFIGTIRISFLQTIYSSVTAFRKHFLLKLRSYMWHLSFVWVIPPRPPPPPPPPPPSLPGPEDCLQTYSGQAVEHRGAGVLCWSGCQGQPWLYWSQSTVVIVSFCYSNYQYVNEILNRLLPK